MFQSLRFISRHPLSSRNRGAALSRWLRWQIGSRMLNQPVIFPWVENSVLVAETGMTGVTGNIYCGLHEFADMAFLLHFLREGDGFADIGANIGSFTVLASFVSGARSVAFEPLPITYSKLLRNVAANEAARQLMGHRSGVSCHMAAVGRVAGNVRFTVDRDTMNQVVSEAFVGQTVDVPVVRIDDVLRDFGAALWKIDVEGYEEEVVEGAGDRLADPDLKAVMLETETPRVVEAMTEKGFERVSYDPFTRTFAAPKASASSNQLWIRDRQFCEVRVRESRSFSVNGVTF